MRTPSGTNRSVLVVDDDAELCQLLIQYLKPEGYAVEAVHTGTDGIRHTLTGDYSIVVLDVMLPDIKGFEVLRRLRTQSRVPILMLTARGDEYDRILGLELGADDYLAKPFNPRELCARVEAILRRTVSGAMVAVARDAERIIIVDDIALDRAARIVRRGGELLDLTSVEFDLLETLLEAAGRVIHRHELVRTVLRRDFSPFDRSIDTHVSNLRKKLGPATHGAERISSIRSVGYQYNWLHSPVITEH